MSVELGIGDAIKTGDVFKRVMPVSERAMAAIVQTIIKDSIQKMDEMRKKQPRHFAAAAKKNRMDELIVDALFKNDTTKEYLQTANAVFSIGEPKLAILKQVHNGKTPYQVFSEGNAPEGLRKKKYFLRAVSELIADKWLIKKPLNDKRSDWSVNRVKLGKKLNLSPEFLFE